MWFLHFYQTCAALFGIIQLAYGAFIRLYCNDDISLNNFIEVPINTSESLIGSECFKSRRKNFFYAFGYMGTVDNNRTIEILQTVVSLRIYNTFLLNWQEEASGQLISNIVTPLNPHVEPGTGFNASAIPFAFKVGTDLGLALARMSQLGMNLSVTSLVGHSLGAQLIGQAGRTVKAGGEEVERIVGLDPAGSGFNTPLDFAALNAGDGKSVLCLHTDPGGEGTNKTLCRIDIMANFIAFTLANKSKRVQPGCQLEVSSEHLCSHSRSVSFFAEAIRLKDMVASKAKNVWDWSRGLGNCSDTIVLGLDWDETKSGVYFMNTTASPPFGLEDAGSCPSSALP